MTDITLTTDPQRAFRSNFTQAGYEAAVATCQEYIRAGDIFQVVLSQRLELDTKSPPLDIYRALRIVNPSPFMFLLRTSAASLIGSSPEIMVRVEDGRTTIRPLAGTRKRGKTEAEDKALEQELLADEKERAEPVMLVDLARNDVGRVAEYGSVEVSEVMPGTPTSHEMIDPQTGCFFVTCHRQDNVGHARRSFLRESRNRRQHGRKSPLHVARTSTVDASLFFDRIERRNRHSIDGNRILMRIQ